MNDIAICPGCGNPATHLGPVGGWHFWCASCQWGWGHPQDLSYHPAAEWHDAKRRAAETVTASQEKDNAER